MNRDLIIGLSVSAALHGGAFFTGLLFEKNTPVAPGRKEAPVIELIQLPPASPEDEPEIPDSIEDEPEKPSEPAPPMAPEIVSLVKLDNFVQKPQTPPAPGIERPTGSIVIPTGRPGVGNPGARIKELFSLDNLDHAPQARLQAKPSYPFEMRKAGITGEVLVGFIVSSSGDVLDATALKSSSREFESAAVQAVSKWKFKPGRKAGRAVNTRMQIPILFNIADD